MDRLRSKASASGLDRLHSSRDGGFLSDNFFVRMRNIKYPYKYKGHILEVSVRDTRPDYHSWTSPKTFPGMQTAQMRSVSFGSAAVE